MYIVHVLSYYILVRVQRILHVLRQLTCTMENSCQSGFSILSSNTNYKHILPSHIEDTKGSANATLKVR